MPFLFRIFDALRPLMHEGSQDAAKCIAETAIALSFLRRHAPDGTLPAGAAARVADGIHGLLHSDGFLRLVVNGFVVQQCITPYVFLRGTIPVSPFHEALIDDFREYDRAVAEAMPYRRMERAFLLHELGEGPLPDWTGAPIFADALQAATFNRDMAYAFTHTVLYATGFGGIARPDDWVKGVAQLLAAKSLGEDDLDLFLECALCLMSQPVDAAELADLVAMIASAQARNLVMMQTPDAPRHYHPLLVHDMLWALMLRNHGIDIRTAAPAAAGPGPLCDLQGLAAALAGKDAARIGALHRAHRMSYGARPWLDRLVRHRLATLRSLAARHVLFARELATLGADAPQVYSDYLCGCDALLAGLPDEGPGLHRPKQGQPGRVHYGVASGGGTG